MAAGSLLGGIVLAACGGQAVPDESNDAGDTGGSRGVGGTGGTGGTAEEGGSGGGPETGGGLQPPDKPDAGPGGGPGAAYAFSRILMGDTTYDGTPSPTAWKDYGYDIDGVVSTPSAPGHCQPQDGAIASNVKTDGTNGIDNSYGANIVPVIIGLATDASKQLNDGLQEGRFSFILDIHGLGSDPSYGLLETAFLVGADLGGPPAWDGSDLWPIACEGLETCLPSGTPDILPNTSKHYLTESYVNNGVYVSGMPGDIDLLTMVHAQGQELLLFLPSKIHRTVITAELAPGSPTPTEATHGILSGVVDTEEYIDEVHAMAGLISTSLCSGPTWDSVASQMRAASDIMNDGTQDPNQICNGISIGLGFDALPVQVGPVQDKQPVPPDPCGGY